LCGALDPYPLIEDGDFTIPTANVGHNVIAIRGESAPRVTVIAHVDTKPGTPGAVDNATGVVILLLLADLLSPDRHPRLPIGAEILVVNGEDHYAAPGELDWLAANEDRLADIPLVVNLDGAGYAGGRTAYSTYNLDAGLTHHVDSSFAGRPSVIPGPEFYQSDHAIFAMRGRPAVALTTELLDEMLDDLFHSPDDTPDRVDLDLLLDTASAISDLITTWPAS